MALMLRGPSKRRLKNVRSAAMPPPAGLCDSCRHQRVIRNTRGSSFSLCERSKAEPEFPRYPRLPVVKCRGYEPR
jgi:hypothetical protein